jgi:hypothetical protein
MNAYQKLVKLSNELTGYFDPTNHNSPKWADQDAATRFARACEVHADLCQQWQSPVRMLAIRDNAFLQSALRRTS